MSYSYLAKFLIKLFFSKLFFLCMCIYSIQLSRDCIYIVSQLDHTDNDCLCVITLTHGLQRDIICANDVMYESNELWKPFAADKCLTLAGKPKLFFIQVNQITTKLMFSSLVLFLNYRHIPIYFRFVINIYTIFCLGL